MKKKSLKLLFFLFANVVFHSHAQNTRPLINKNELGVIFFKDETRFVIRNKNEVSEYDFTLIFPLLEKYSFDPSYLNDILYLDSRYLINTSGIYHHQFFKDFKKISEFPIRLEKVKNKEEELPHAFSFFAPRQTLIVTNDIKKQVNLINVQTGQVETYTLKTEKGDKLRPLNNSYAVVVRYKKGESTKYILYNLKTHEQKESSFYSGCLPLSDTLVFLKNFEHQFMNLETGETYKRVNGNIRPNIACCYHKIDQTGRYIISRSGFLTTPLTFSIFDLQKNKIITSSDYDERTEKWVVYNNKMKEVLPDDMTNPFSDIAVSPDNRHVVFSEGDWVLVMDFIDYKKIMEEGNYEVNRYLKNKQTTGTSGTVTTKSNNNNNQNNNKPSPSVKLLNTSFTMVYKYMVHGKDYKPFDVKIEVTPNTIQEYLAGKRGDYSVIWGSPCNIQNSWSATYYGKPGYYYECSSGKKYYFYKVDSKNVLRVQSSDGQDYFDYVEEVE
jgi:hypothetical protein